MNTQQGDSAYHVNLLQGAALNAAELLADQRWATAVLLSDFSYPWRQKTAPPVQFRALHDDVFLYFNYQVETDTVITLLKTNAPEEVLESDRVEIFFKANGAMAPYYCLEMDAAGRLLDYRAKFHRDMDWGWAWPTEEILIVANSTDVGYTVGGRISKASLRELGVLDGQGIEAGLFRGEATSMVEGKANLQWISWIRPEVEVPDFHVPSAFGRLYLG